MKVYFTTALRGKATYLQNYRQIVDCLKKMGFSVQADHVLADGIEDRVKLQTDEEREKVYKELLLKIRNADMLVAEISAPSISVGHEISYALEQSKPVVVFHVPGKSSSLLEGMDSEKLKMISYTLETLEEQMSKAVEEAKKMVDVRFNFFVSPKILNYLDWVSQTKKVPRSVFLRELIEKEMKKDKDFKG